MKTKKLTPKVKLTAAGGLMLLSVFATCTTAQAAQTTSPDGRTAFEFSMDDDSPRAVVSYDGKRVCDMALGLVRGKYSVLATNACTVNGVWKPVWGFCGEYPENYIELEVTLAEKGGKRPIATLQLRAYDEGFAVRAKHLFSAYGLAEIVDEVTSWRFPEGTKAWCIPWTEATYPERPLDVTSLDPKVEWRMPFTVEIPGAGYASVIEADVESFPRSWIVNTASPGAGGGLRLKYAVGVKEGRGEIVSPWRALILASTAGALVERAYLVENLNPPCAIGDTDWIKPGFCVSDARNCRLKTDEVILAAKSAKAIGAKYFQIDWGWYGTEYPWSEADREMFRAGHPELADEMKDGLWVANTRADPFTPARGFVPYHPYWPYNCHRRSVDLDLPKIVAELRKLDLGICLYVHGSVLEANDLDRLFATY